MNDLAKYQSTAGASEKASRRIESCVHQLEQLLKMASDQNERLQMALDRAAGGELNKATENHPEPVPSGTVGQLEMLINKLAERLGMHDAKLLQLDRVV